MTVRRPGKRSKVADLDRSPVSPLLLILFSLCLLGILAIYSPESLPLLGIGMLPTLGAVFASREDKGLWLSVGWLNFAGLSNWLLGLWSSDHTMGYATAQLRTVAPILVGYAAAALGWFLFMAMPAVTGAVIAANLRRRKVKLAGLQRKLVEQWDSGITGLRLMAPRPAPKDKPPERPAVPAPPVPPVSQLAGAGR